MQWAEPDWSMVADWDAALGARTRRDLGAEYGPLGTLVLGTHSASPSAGRLVADGDGWTFAAEE